MAHAERQKRLLERITQTSFLYPEFREQFRDLSIAMQQQHMPFILYETYRTPYRQKKLIDAGLSKIIDPYSSTHVHGLAADFLIDTRVVNSSAKEELSGLTKGDAGQKKKKRSKSKQGEAIYNIGVNVVSLDRAKPRTIIEDKLVLTFWMALGDLIRRQYPDLSWGGDWGREKGQLIGVDPPHVEFKKARTIMQNKPTLNILKAQGNPGIGVV